MTERLRVRVPAEAVGDFFFSAELFSVPTLIRCPFQPVLPQLHVKEPGHLAKSAGGVLNLSMHEALNQGSGSGLTLLSIIAWEFIRGQAHTEHVRKHSTRVVSAR